MRVCPDKKYKILTEFRQSRTDFSRINIARLWRYLTTRIPSCRIYHRNYTASFVLRRYKKHYDTFVPTGTILLSHLTGRTCRFFRTDDRRVLGQFYEAKKKMTTFVRVCNEIRVELSSVFAGPEICLQHKSEKNATKTPKIAYGFING